jgi:hypothetical protein
MTIEGMDKIETAGTSAGNYDLDTVAICAKIQSWSSLCNLRVLSADRASIKIGFDTLPADMDTFASDVYSFCPDIVDQGTGCVREVIEEMGVPPNLAGLVEDLDFSDDHYGLEILKRLIARDRQLKLWWD